MPSYNRTIEVLSVIAVIGILTGLVLPCVKVVREAAEKAKAEAELHTMPYLVDEPPDKMPYLEED